ncbi:spondin domain-containing protein [Pseudoalteromonas sp. SSDWG2]|uniref:spondin domain-containing protein n=1 Tax=Pseudoalteromonas sp. SSDWG2 TaxID=3139391 RepID=UPI003BAB93DC
MKSLPKLTIAGVMMACAQNAYAAELEISIQNLTQGVYFTPLLITAHSSDAHLFELAQPASMELQAMAEGGSLDGLMTVVDGAGANSVANPAGGLLAPAQATSAMLSTTHGNTQLSVVGMILPSNDGFVGLDSWTIPSEPGTYHVYLKAYDAGTEANDEIRGGGAPGTSGMPVPPPLESVIGTGGSGVAMSQNNMTVHIHPGSIGDDDSTGGKSDLNNTVHRWLNPVAKLTVTVQ